MWESQPCWVTSTSGANARTSGGTIAWKARSHPASAVPGGSATFTAVPSACGPPESSCEAGAGKEHLPGLVQRDRQHPRVVVEDRLDAVAVVDVDVDVGDLLHALVEQPLDADGDVVVDAEAARAVAHRVVQAAGDVGAVEALAGVHLAEGLEAGADHVRRREVHVGEDRVVVGGEPVVVELDRARVLARPRHGVDQARRRGRSRSAPSSANGAGTIRSVSRTPSSRTSRMVRSTRIGDIGCEEPKSYAVSDESKTTVAGPAHSMARNVLLRYPGSVRTTSNRIWWPAS